MSITIHTSSSSSSGSRVNVLREVVGRVSTSYKRDLDASASQTIESASEAGVVLDFIASERLRCMPQSGGRYDKVLRYAELFIMHIAAFSQNVAKAMTNVQEATQQIYGSIHLLLQVSVNKDTPDSHPNGSTAWRDARHSSREASWCLLPTRCRPGGLQWTW